MQLPANAHLAIADGEQFLLMRNAGSAAEARLELVEEPNLDGEKESGAFGHHDARSDDYHTQDGRPASFSLSDTATPPRSRHSRLSSATVRMTNSRSAARRSDPGSSGTQAPSEQIASIEDRASGYPEGWMIGAILVGSFVNATFRLWG